MRTLSSIRTDFIEFLREAFSSGHVKANGQTIFRWDEDEAKTKIIIQGDQVTNPATLSKTPAILVSRLDVSPEENSKGLKNSARTHDWETGFTEHAYVVKGPMVISCISSNPEEAEIMAQMVYSMIEQHKPYLRKKYLYRGIILGGIGKPRILKYEGEGTSVTAWNCGVAMEVLFHFGYRYKQMKEGIGDMDFQFLKPQIAWLDQE